MDIILQPWPWYVGGPAVALIMLALIYLGKSFGFSSNFRTICSALGAGKTCSFFQFDWKSQRWNLIFLLGSIFGGFIGANLLSDNQIPVVAQSIVEKLEAYNIYSTNKAYVPSEIYGEMSMSNIIYLVVGGLFVGFGTRYAGGCTSGHAISGLSNLQLPSLIAVIGFFIGGILMTHLIFPFIF